MSRVKFILTVNLDPMPGSFHIIENAQKNLQAILDNMIGHYDPVVTVVEDQPVVNAPSEKEN